MRPRTHSAKCMCGNGQAKTVHVRQRARTCKIDGTAQSHVAPLSADEMRASQMNIETSSQARQATEVATRTLQGPGGKVRLQRASQFEPRRGMTDCRQRLRRAIAHTSTRRRGLCHMRLACLPGFTSGGGGGG